MSSRAAVLHVTKQYVSILYAACMCFPPAIVFELEDPGQLRVPHTKHFIVWQQEIRHHPYATAKVTSGKGGHRGPLRIAWMVPHSCWRFAAVKCCAVPATFLLIVITESAVVCFQARQDAYLILASCRRHGCGCTERLLTTSPAKYMSTQKGSCCKVCLHGTHKSGRLYG